MNNPFTMGIATKKDFCNRKQEITDLLTHARNGGNVVMYSPRRYGKSSLIDRVFEKLRNEGFLTVYADLFPISSERDFVQILSTAVIEGLGRGADPHSFIQKIGKVFKMIVPTLEVKPDGYSFSLKFERPDDTEVTLSDLMDGIYTYVKSKRIKLSVCCDEFQEIVELPESRKIEGVLRSKIQRHKEISYFFVGSRRRILTDMFTSKSRPFYKLAHLYALKEIAESEFVKCIVSQFKRSSKQCDNETACLIYNMVRGYSYYVQKLCIIAWDLTRKRCSPDIAAKAYKHLLDTESVDFEGIWSGLTMTHRAVLKAIATEPTSSPYTREYLAQHGLSIGGTQLAIRNLMRRDIIEKDSENNYRVTDPVFAAWMTK